MQAISTKTHLVEKHGWPITVAETLVDVVAFRMHKDIDHEADLTWGYPGGLEDKHTHEDAVIDMGFLSLPWQVQEAISPGSLGGKDRCEVCARVIQAMIFKGTGVCCDNCRKVRAGETRADAD